MDTFRVWLRPMGGFCRVRVDGLRNAQWLLTQLGLSFVFKTAEPIHEVAGSAICNFKVPYKPQFSRCRFEELLLALPQVELMQDPE